MVRGLSAGGGGVSYLVEWESTELYCVECGQRPVLVQRSGGGDYYAGEQFKCWTCGAEFYLA